MTNKESDTERITSYNAELGDVVASAYESEGKNGQSMGSSIEFGDAAFTVNQNEEYGGTRISSEVKFDNYFMYGIDQYGGDPNSVPRCGSNVQAGQDDCKERFGFDSCCAHVIMTNQGSGQQMSFYRCMSEQMVDLSFSVEIDGMSVAMGCTQPSGAFKMAANGLFAAVIAVIGLTLF